MSAQRVISDLRELAARTSTPDGAQRLAWGPVWRDARAWFKGKVAEIGLGIRTDSAGNNFVTLPGASPTTVLVGSHLDSVPNGGWLDGCLVVLAGLEALRMHAGATPPVTLVERAAWLQSGPTQIHLLYAEAPTIPPEGHTGSRPLLEPKGVLYSDSGYEDLSRIWTDREKLFGAKAAKALEKFG